MLVLGALMTALWLLVRERPVQEWWLPLLLLILAGLIGLWPARQAAADEAEAEAEQAALPALQQPRVREFIASEVRAHALAAPAVEAEHPAVEVEAEAELVAEAGVVEAEPEAAEVSSEPSETLAGTTPEMIEGESIAQPSEVPAADESAAAVSAAFAAPAAVAESTALEPVPTQTETAPEPEPAKPKRSRASAEVDDLKRIEGIGPKMEKALHAASIKTFARLAEASEDELRAAIEAHGLRFAPSLPTWAKQAAFLARGDEAGFEAYKEKLIAGREVD